MADPYGVEPGPSVPELPGVQSVHETEDGILDALAAEIYLQSLACVRTFGDYHLALSAGGFQERLCRRLMIDPNVRGLPWSRTHVWAISDGPDSRGRAAFSAIQELLIDQAGIPDSHLHVPDHSVDRAADEYEHRLQQILAWREKGQDRLDTAVLVVGADGRYGGVDPESAIGRTENRLVVPASGGMAMTARLINATRLITVVATGASAGERLREKDGGGSFPKPVGGSLRWYLDRGACPA